MAALFGAIGPLPLCLDAGRSRSLLHQPGAPGDENNGGRTRLGPAYRLGVDGRDMRERARPSLSLSQQHKFFSTTTPHASRVEIGTAYIPHNKHRGDGRRRLTLM